MIRTTISIFQFVFMSNLNEKWAPVTIFAVTLMLTMAPILSGPVLANKKKGTSDLTNPSMTVADYTQYQLKGKVLNVNGPRFSIRDTVFNNSSATITITNGTCTSPLPIRFNKTVMIQNQAMLPPVKHLRNKLSNIRRTICYIESNSFWYGLQNHRSCNDKCNNLFQL